MLSQSVNWDYGILYSQDNMLRVENVQSCVWFVQLWAGSAVPHHGQRHDARQLFLCQADFRLGLLWGNAADRVLHLPGHPAAACWLRESFQLEIHLEHPLNCHVWPTSAQKKDELYRW